MQSLHEHPLQEHSRPVRALLRTGAGAALMLSIMVIGSVVLWVGTPLAWLWIASQLQGAIESLGTSIVVAFVGIVATIMALAWLLSRLSDVYRANCRARGRGDPGHSVLEAVLIISAAVSTAVFAVWFLFFAGAAPAPIGINI